MNIKGLVSNSFTIRIIVNSDIYKIFKIIFSKRDGSIFVSFPYFKEAEGIVSILKWPANVEPPTTLKLDTELGRVTSYLVKYSHHPDGYVQFSQDSKIYSYPKNRKSLPLSMNIGHIFTTQFQNLEYFTKEKKCSDTPVDFYFRKKPKAIKIVGRWQKIPNYNFFSKEEVINYSKNPQGKKEPVIILKQPNNLQFHDHILLLNNYEIPKLNKKDKGVLTFIGGFDSKEIANDLTKDFYCLGLIYPVNNKIELRDKIGTLDFNIK
ncbi:MAG: hypothetical protein ACYCXQ_13600 [Candidatus Humimicrobiaceae bacterium]